MNYLYIPGTVLFTVYGQLILKWRIQIYGEFPDALSEKLFFLLKAIIDPYILSGFAAGFIAALFWIAAMTKYDLSYAYPLIVAGLLLLTTTLGVIVLNEPMTAGKICGAILISLGMISMYVKG